MKGFSHFKLMGKGCLAMIVRQPFLLYYNYRLSLRFETVETLRATFLHNKII